MHTMGQEEGRQQEDALLPILFSFCQLGAFNAVQNRLVEGERQFAFLDDAYVVTTIGRLGRPPKELWRHPSIGIHEGNHPVCNAAGTRPLNCEGSAKQRSGSRRWSTTESCSPEKNTTDLHRTLETTIGGACWRNGRSMVSRRQDTHSSPREGPNQFIASPTATLEPRIEQGMIWRGDGN